MTDEAQHRLERLNADALAKLQALSDEMNDLVALEAEGGDNASLQARREAVVQKMREMAPQIEELRNALKAVQRRQD